ncbi:MAG TPA: hypothetical protein V6D27_02770, partial [Vampirovibrionales bacterium]
MTTGRKIQRNQPNATSVPQTGLFQPRPFAAPAPSEAASPQAAPTADVQAKLENQPSGDRLSRVDFSAPPPIQPKLTVGAAGDIYEQEADRVARQVVNRIQAPQVNFQSSESNPVQRKISIQAFGGEGGEVSSEWESELNRASVGKQVRQEEPTVGGTAKPIQAKGGETPNQTGLPDNLKAGVENLSGYSLDDVRVYYNSPKPA